jgi:hypothetical protein
MDCAQLTYPLYAVVLIEYTRGQSAGRLTNPARTGLSRTYRQGMGSRRYRKGIRTIWRQHDGDCAFWSGQVSGFVQMPKTHHTMGVLGQSPLISVSQLFMTERSDPTQQGGARL